MRARLLRQLDKVIENRPRTAIISNCPHILDLADIPLRRVVSHQRQETIAIGGIHFSIIMRLKVEGTRFVVQLNIA